MGTIICATRGGEASYRAQDAAIALAREHGHQLVFVYVVDTSFLDQTAAPLVVNVEERLERMGRFQLVVAQERATEQGVSAQAMVRRGSLQCELVDATREVGAEMIVLGHPVGSDTSFSPSGLKALATRIKVETGVEALIV
ncbi:MAG: universal stress protein [Anaerolineae bacterium]|nr:universal stress protein [Anaerolineae bacterium]